jgi:hypothetical protein
MAVYMLVVLVHDGVHCVSHGLVVVDVGVSGSSHDSSIIASLITSKIPICFFLCRWTTRQVRQAKNLQWGGEYEKKGMPLAMALTAVQQLRSWIVHNRKLIQHSVKVAKAQSKLQIHHIQQFLSFCGTTQSKTALPVQRPAPRRHRITRISNFFQAVAQPRRCIRTLTAIDETTATILNGLQRRIIRRRQLNLPDLFPDHPG